MSNTSIISCIKASPFQARSKLTIILRMSSQCTKYFDRLQSLAGICLNLEASMADDDAPLSRIWQ